VPGQWFFSDSGRAKIGLVRSDDKAPAVGSRSTDGLSKPRTRPYPHFLYLECGENRREATGYLEIPQGLFTNFIADNRFLAFRSRNGETQIQEFISTIMLIENGAGGAWWFPKLVADRRLLEQWSGPGRLEIQIGERIKMDFVRARSYILPELNRAAATTAFIAACFR
jgi:hypothetical protein